MRRKPSETPHRADRQCRRRRRSRRRGGRLRRSRGRRHAAGLRRGLHPTRSPRPRRGPRGDRCGPRRVAGALVLFPDRDRRPASNSDFNAAMAMAHRARFRPDDHPTLVLPEIAKGAGFIDRHAEEAYRSRPTTSYPPAPRGRARRVSHRWSSIGPAPAPRWSTCYRREAGSWQDTRGIIRSTSSTRSRCSSIAARAGPRPSTAATPDGA